MSEKANFEVRDVGLGSSSGDAAEDEKKYMGVERRRTTRRSGIDRRTEVRFEISKDDRRENHGRRHDDEAGHVFW